MERNGILILEAENSVEKVFSIELLRDKILNNAIRNGNEVCGENIRICRLVSKDWLSSVSRCLRKSKEPLFKFKLNATLLDKFVEWVSGYQRLELQIPTFEVTARTDFLCIEKCNSLFECFDRCGSSLVKLNMHLPMNYHAFRANLSFPNLQSLTLLYVKTSGIDFANDKGVGSLTQQIFSGSGSLTNLHLDLFWFDNYVPYFVDGLKMPTSIKELILTCFDLKSEHIELLVQNSLPSLEKLLIYYLGSPLSDNAIYRLLANFKESLTHFGVLSNEEEYSDDDTRRENTFFHFPQMNKLTYFKSDSINLELDDNRGLLQNKLPVLENLGLVNQTVPMVLKWMENGQLNSVTTLMVKLMDDEMDYINFPLEVMNGVKTTFPNLQALIITLSGWDLNALKFAFQHLVTLKVLKVSVAMIEEDNDGIDGSDRWSALLIGIPAKLAKVLRETEFWDDIQFSSRKQPKDSIKNLTGLRVFTLQTIFPEEKDTLISDAVFKFAFFEMQQLAKIVFWGRFMVSPEMKKEWESSGRTFLYEV